MSATAPALDYDAMAHRAFTALVNASDEGIAKGAGWYPEAWEECKAVAARYPGVTPRMVAAITAVFSSFMPWERNVPAAEKVIRAYAEGRRGSELPGVTRNYDCVRKAEAILGGANPMTTIVKREKARSQCWKTLVFYMNIIGRTTRRACIDVWMYRILSGDMASQHRPKGAEFMLCERAIREAADRVGLRACDAQAIMWCTVTGKGAKA
jgi:hypothetical protein